MRQIKSVLPVDDLGPILHCF